MSARDLLTRERALQQQLNDSLSQLETQQRRLRFSGPIREDSVAGPISLTTFATATAGANIVAALELDAGRWVIVAGCTVDRSVAGIYEVVMDLVLPNGSTVEIAGAARSDVAGADALIGTHSVTLVEPDSVAIRVRFASDASPVAAAESIFLLAWPS